MLSIPPSRHYPLKDVGLEEKNTQKIHSSQWYEIIYLQILAFRKFYYWLNENHVVLYYFVSSVREQELEESRPPSRERSHSDTWLSVNTKVVKVRFYEIPCTQLDTIEYNFFCSDAD